MNNFIFRNTVTKQILQSYPPQAGQEEVTSPMPSSTNRLLNFTKAAISHVLNGSPTCTQEQIDERIIICRACPYFRPNRENGGATGICGHMGCGCNLNTEVKYLNKLSWKDQSCPIGRWGVIQDEKEIIDG